MTEQDEIAAERVALRDVREKFGKKVGHDCDEWMCQKTVDDGVLFRVNPRGRPGIFMCAEHAAVTDQGENR
ncbi:hypothetical protein FVO59_11875 [Microbacterium esteraromaticum]|uniref:Uncharacterized protein n=1 Tax=Microbacterium esteraromaticum TaxID=57043 RepID=A0A7D8AKL7_9MICO|nr:hypothetical protein [Microbacterium esteraromaticum]QMU97826.1 hypothetical protein FVO59_11875 [Microbacterium esteraromaticum]